MTTWQAFGATHIGGRDENQDCWVILHDHESRELLAVVADGMGGHDRGGEAARMVVEAAREIWSQQSAKSSLEGRLHSIVDSAHQRIRHFNDNNASDAQSTLAALWLRAGEAASIHVGDSRITQFTEAAVVERTLDHSMAQIQVLRGKIREEDMANHPDQARLMTSVGGTEAPEPEYRTWGLERGDRFVVCSDGFWEIVPTEAQVDLLASPDPATALEAEIHARLEAADDGHDNTTAILVRPAAAPDAPAPRSRAAAGTVAALALLAAAGLAWYLFTPQPDPQEDEPVAESGEEAGEASTAGEDGTKSDESTTAEQAEGNTENESDKGGTTAESEAGAETTAETTVPGGESEGGTTEGGKKAPAIEAGELDPLNESVRIDYPADADGAAVLTEWLREAGLLGEEAVVEHQRSSDAGEDGALIRFKIYHDGLPVLGSVVTARVVDGEIVKLQGELPVDIVLPEGEILAYPDALARAAEMTGEEFSVRDEPTLYVYRSDSVTNTYTRAWHGLIAVDGDGLVHVLVDAHDGSLLHRWSATTDQPT